MAQPGIVAHLGPESHAERFVIKTKLGSGGLGEVFLAEDSLLKRSVALKAFRTEKAEEPGFYRHLLREAERASKISDEHVARIHDVVEQAGRTFLVMEYVEGQTLRARLRRPLALKDFFSIAEQCLAGLAAAHSHGILHCDLKPENLMITPAETVKILDFGFARYAPGGETRDSLELSSAIGGTLSYLAPEVLQGETPDQRSDIFSLGVVLFEALARYHPFHTETGALSVERILRGEPRRLPGPVPAGLDLVLLRMMARDPRKRYQNCADALADLEAVRAGEGHALASRVPRRTRLPMQKIAALAAVLTLGALLLPKSHLPASSASAASRQLVVLPFQPSGSDAGSRAFSTGLTETLAAKMGQIAELYPLEIVAPSEVRAQKVTNAQQARTILGATMVLEGSLQQSGNTVRVIYSLVDTRSLRQVHSGVVTADASNPFAVQDRVIDEVLSRLDIELEKEDRGRMQAHGTSEPQAYEAYLRGRGYLQEFDRAENLESAITAFQSSVQADPRFALGYAGLGQAYLKKYGLEHLSESVDRAQAACSRATELDGNSPDGEICLGMLSNETGNYQAAAGHLERALTLDPRRDEPYRELATAYEGLNRLPDAESRLMKAIALHPQYWAGYKRLGAFYYTHGRYDDAVKQFRQVIVLAPDSFSGYSNLGAIYTLQGKYAEAIEALERSTAIRPTSSALNNLGAAYFYQRKYQDAARTYQRAGLLTPADYRIFGNMGECYNQIGNQDESRKNYVLAMQFVLQALKVNTHDGRVLSYAALYAAKLEQRAEAEGYRRSAVALSNHDPQTYLNSALVLAHFHQDAPALAELDQAVSVGLAASEITNDPAWERFSSNRKYAEIVASAKRINNR